MYRIHESIYTIILLNGSSIDDSQLTPILSAAKGRRDVAIFDDDNSIF